MRPAPSSQSTRREIELVIILDPLMHLFFARTIEIANLVRIKAIVLLYGRFHYHAHIMMQIQALDCNGWTKYQNVCALMSHTRLQTLTLFRIRATMQCHAPPLCALVCLNLMGHEDVKT